MTKIGGALDIFDSYSRQARLYPALLTILPWLLSAAVVTPTTLMPRSTTMWAGLLLCLGSALYAMASIARTVGKRAEASLLKSWGGWPTTKLLRHTGQLDPHTRGRYHAFLFKQVKGLKPPTPAQEASDAEACDAIYASAVAWLKEKTRGNEFNLLLKENAQYGFRRNLLGLRPFGLAISGALFVMSLLVLLASSATGLAGHAFGTLFPTTSQLASLLIINGVAFYTWYKLVQPEWVREAAQQYAERLLSCCDVLGQSPAKRTSEPHVRLL
jgi:hypothetical protein